MNQTFKNPCLSVYLFFSGKEGQAEAQTLQDKLKTRLNQNSHIDPAPVCRQYERHDTLVLYVSFEQKNDVPQTWQPLKSGLIDLLPMQRKRDKFFWGMSLLYSAEVDSLNFDTTALQNEVFPNAKEVSISTKVWGTFWQLSDEPKDSPHIYMVLIEDKVAGDKVLFSEKAIDVPELSLHKCYQDIDQHETNRAQLHELVRDIDGKLETLLNDSAPARQSLTNVSKSYVQFAKWASQLAALQNTVKINQSNYERFAKHFGLLSNEDGADLFVKHQRRIQQGLDQIEADNKYAEAAMQRFSNALETARANYELVTMEQETQSARRERWRDVVLGFIGIVLGLTQVCPLAAEIVKVKFPTAEFAFNLFSFTIITTFLCIFGIVLVGLLFEHGLSKLFRKK